MKIKSMVDEGLAATSKDYIFAFKLIRARYPNFLYHFSIVSILFLFTSALSSYAPYLLRQAANGVGDLKGFGFYFYASAYAICWTFVGVLQNIKGIFSAGILARSDAALNKVLLKSIINSPYSWQKKIDIGVVSQDISRAAQSFSSITTSLFWMIIPIFFEFVISIAIINSAIGGRFALLFGGCILMLSFASYFIASKSGSIHSSIFSSQNSLQSFVVERLGALLEIRLNAAKEREDSLADSYLGDLVKTIWSANLRMGIYLGGQALAIGLVLGVFTIYSAGLNSNGNLSSGDFVMIAGYVGLLSMQLRFLSGALIELKRQQVALRRGLNYVTPEALARPSASEQLPVASDQTFFELNEIFVAIEDRELISNLSYKFKKEAFTVIAAPSGVGKTTLIHSMLGLLPVSSGVVNFRGRAIDQYSSDEILKYVSVAPQIPRIFNDSLRFNLTYGCEAHVSDQVLIEMLSLLEYAPATLDENGLPNLEELLGAGGRTLSGGEIQRVAIGRALLQNKEAIILDEPTSHLNQELARRIIDSILARQKTLIVITHDQEIIEMAQELLVLPSLASLSQ